MPKTPRHAFRPALTDTLEERVVLSHSAAAATAAAGLHAAGRHGPPPLPAGPPAMTVGALGDSYTDEYRFYRPNRATARNWVEILHAFRQVRFGHDTTRSRGEPRDQGFAYNWARSDATSADMVRDQLPGLAAQVAEGKVRYAWVFIGGNDYLGLLDAARTGAIAPADVPNAIRATTARLEANFATAVNTLLQASPRVRLVVATLPDVSDLPAVRLAAQGNPVAEGWVRAVDEATAGYNAEVRAAAAGSDRVALVDLAALTEQSSARGTGTIEFGGQTISLNVPSDDYHSFFLGDLIHVGTVAQGIIAEQFVLAIDREFGARLAPPTPRGIVHYAAAIQHHAQRGLRR